MDKRQYEEEELSRLLDEISRNETNTDATQTTESVALVALAARLKTAAGNEPPAAHIIEETVNKINISPAIDRKQKTFLQKFRLPAIVGAVAAAVLIVSIQAHVPYPAPPSKTVVAPSVNEAMPKANEMTTNKETKKPQDAKAQDAIQSNSATGNAPAPTKDSSMPSASAEKEVAAVSPKAVATKRSESPPTVLKAESTATFGALRSPAPQVSSSPSNNDMSADKGADIIFSLPGRKADSVTVDGCNLRLVFNYDNDGQIIILQPTTLCSLASGEADSPNLKAVGKQPNRVVVTLKGREITVIGNKSTSELKKIAAQLVETTEP